MRHRHRRARRDESLWRPGRGLQRKESCSGSTRARRGAPGTPLESAAALHASPRRPAPAPASGQGDHPRGRPPGAAVFPAGRAHQRQGLEQGRRLAGDGSRRDGGHLPEGAPERADPRCRLALGGDPRRSGPPLPRPRLDRRSDRRNPRLPVGRSDWSIAVALLAHGQPVLGHVAAPVTATLYEAVAGEGATKDGVPIRVSSQAGMAGARVTGPKPMADRLERRLASAGPRTRWCGCRGSPRSPCAWCVAERPGRCRSGLVGCPRLGPRRGRPDPARGRRRRARPSTGRSRSTTGASRSTASSSPCAGVAGAGAGGARLTGGAVAPRSACVRDDVL